MNLTPLEICRGNQQARGRKTKSAQKLKRKGGAATSTERWRYAGQLRAHTMQQSSSATRKTDPNKNAQRSRQEEVQPDEVGLTRFERIWRRRVGSPNTVAGTSLTMSDSSVTPLRTRALPNPGCHNESTVWAESDQSACEGGAATTQRVHSQASRRESGRKQVSKRAERATKAQFTRSNQALGARQGKR